MKKTRFLSSLFAIVLILASVAKAGPLDWPAAGRECRPWVYNWWLGSAVDRENLTRELGRYREGGLGGVHVIPIYGAKGAEDRYIEYLSAKWMEMFAFAVQEGERFGLGVDMTTGTGWCFGGPNISPDLGGRKVVIKQIPFPTDARLPGELRPSTVTIQALVARSPDGRHQEIMGSLRPDGSLGWQPPADGWTLLVLGHQSAGRMVKRAAPGGAGPMINPLDAEAMRKYLERFTAAFGATNGARPRAMYHDSYEYDSDWSADLPREFAVRRGYRIEDELEALAGLGDGDRRSRVRCDLSETISDLTIEKVFPQWVRWCHDRGMQTRNQAHGSGANWLDFYVLADIPETEMFGHGGPDPLVSRFDEHIGGADRNPLISKFASSAAHAAGKPLVAAETGTWLAEHFCETFEELKCEIDLLLLAGVNHVFYHGCVYSPDDAAWPGWLFYASTEMNPRNPLWREAPALNGYVTRCQSVLQSGRIDNDVLLYWPIHDAWSRGITAMSVHNKAALDGPLGLAAKTLWERGYGFDYVSDRLVATMGTRVGAIQGPDGASWRVVVVPECRQMPHTTLAKLRDLAEQGATIVFENRLPEDVPGLGNLAERRAALAKLLAPLKADGGSASADSLRSVRCGKGVVVIGPLANALTSVGVKRETMADARGLKFLRRKHDAGHHYFLAHHGLEPLDGWIPLATPAESIVILDPMTGVTGIAEIRRASDGGAEVHVRLDPGHSILLRTLAGQRIEGTAFRWSRPGEPVAEIQGPWQIDFVAGGPALPKAVTMERLRSWTASGEPSAESFAGTARYRCHFDVSAWPDRGQQTPVLLDLGEVKHVARVRVNDKDLGTLLMHPYRLPIPADILREGENVLEVEVTNVAANRIRDLDRRKVPWRVFHDINLVNLRYGPFDASGWPVFDSGLLGPVRILRTP